MGTNFLTKVARISGDFGAFTKNVEFKEKTDGATFGKFGLLFIPTSGHSGRPLTLDFLPLHPLPFQNLQIGIETSVTRKKLPNSKVIDFDTFTKIA